MDGDRANTDTVVTAPSLALHVELAVIEMLELLVLTLAQHTTSEKCCGIKVKVSASDSNDDGNKRWFYLDVQCVGIHEFAVHIKEFLKDHGRCLRHVLSEMEKVAEDSFLVIKLPAHDGKTGRLIKVQMCGVGKESAEIHVTEEEFQQERRSLSAIFKVYQDIDRMLEECQYVYAYMHRLKLTHPELEIEFHLNIGTTKSKSSFCSDGPKTTFGARKIATDIKHFIQSPSDCDQRVKVKSGTSSMLPPVQVLQNKAGTSFRLSSYAFLVPPPEADVRSLNHMCTHLKVFLYGPCRMPLLLPGVGQSGLSPTSLIKISDYGLLLMGNTCKDKLLEKAEVQADWYYKLQSTETPLDDDEDEKAELCLCVYIMLDTLKPDVEGEKHLNIVDGLRQNVAQILCKLKHRLRKCTSSALNKLLHNYTKQDQKQEMYTSSISTITKSLTSILKRSTNDSFRNACFTAMKVSDSSQFPDAIRQQLWSTASDRYGLTNPLLQNPDAPTDECSLDAFPAQGGTDKTPSSDTAAQASERTIAPRPTDHTARASSSPARLDFFDVLTQHRSPPLPPSSLAKHAGVSYAVGLEKQPPEILPEEAVLDNIEMDTRCTSKLSCGNGTGRKTDDEVGSKTLIERTDSKSLLTGTSMDAAFSSPVMKKRKVKASQSTHQSDYFDTLEFNLGFSPEVVQKQQSTNNKSQIRMSPSSPTHINKTTEKKQIEAKKEVPSTEDWFNDILFD